MHPIFVLVRKDFTNFFRNKAAVSLTFIVPFVMIWLFGLVFGVNRKDSGPSGIPIAVVNASTNPAATTLIDALRSEKSFRVITEFTNPDQSKRPLTEADLRPMMQAPGARFRFALVIPEDLISPTRLGLHLKFFSNPRNEIETQTVNGLLQKTIFSHVPQLIGQSLQARAKQFLGDTKFDRFNGALSSAIGTAFNRDPAEIKRQLESGDFGLSELTKKKPADPTLRRLDTPPATTTPANSAASTSTPNSSTSTSATADVFSRILRFDTEQVVGANVKNPAATTLVGGWAIQFLLFAVSASAASLFRERDAGIFQRLLAAPVTRAHILWSKFLYGVTLGLVQLVVLFLASTLIYGTDVLPHLPLLVLVCIFSAAACTSFGMLLAAVSSSPEAASGLATFLIMLMSAIGGAWFPITFMPEFIQQFSKLTLVYWSMEGFSAVLWAGQSFVQILPILAILGAITAGVMSIAIWRFNRGKIFG
jgi:ABC-2 type transport system permease protein